MKIRNVLIVSIAFLCAFCAQVFGQDTRGKKVIMKALEFPGGKEERENVIATPTLADIYASQGLTDRAFAVLRRLLERSPNRDEVVKKIHELERELATRPTGGDHGYDG